MAVNSRTSTELLIPKKWSDQRAEMSPERTKNIWIEPKTKIGDRKVAVIYYLSRNGQLEHPHFIEVPLSSSHGLYLRDVMNRLNSLRGEGMAYMYAWSSKRSYKNGYVWQDLSEDDLIYPTNGHDYILKGSELGQTALTQTPSSREASSAVERRRKNQSWSSFENADDRREYIIYKCESSREFAGKFGVDTAAQTEEKRRRSGRGGEHGNKSVELSREELSPPPLPSMTCSEGSDGVSGSGDVDRRVEIRGRTAENECNSNGKIKASQVLMQLFTCGSSLPIKHHGPSKSSRGLVMGQT